MTRAIFVLPEGELSQKQFERAHRSFAYRFPAAEIAYAMPSRPPQSYARLLDGRQVLKREDRAALVSFEIAVFLEEVRKRIPTAYDGFSRSQKVYKIDHFGRLNRCGQLDDTDYPFFGTHPFNFAGPRHDDNFYYFPHGYCFRFTGMGPTNEFGHRIRMDIEPLASRPRSHILIAVFGGSAAWSIFSFYDEMFAQRLEDKLNAEAAREGSGLRFTVLNLAMPGNVVLNEMTTYNLFCHALAPDAVIAHDGFNDLYLGEVSSPHLLNRYRITYQYNFEAWSHLLHETSRFPLGWTKDNVPVVNYPSAILGAYRARLRQFRRIVEADGAVFISGLQPMLSSKRAMSPEEAAWVGFIRTYEEPYRNMPYLYEQYCVSAPEKELPHFLNFHRIFSGYGAETSLVGDVMHTTPEGDEVIAEHYFRYLKERLMDTWRSRAV